MNSRVLTGLICAGLASTAACAMERDCTAASTPPLPVAADLPTPSATADKTSTEKLAWIMQYDDEAFDRILTYWKENQCNDQKNFPILLEDLRKKAEEKKKILEMERERLTKEIGDGILREINEHGPSGLCKCIEIFALYFGAFNTAHAKDELPSRLVKLGAKRHAYEHAYKGIELLVEHGKRLDALQTAGKAPCLIITTHDDNIFFGCKDTAGFYYIFEKRNNNLRAFMLNRKKITSALAIDPTQNVLIVHVKGSTPCYLFRSDEKCHDFVFENLLARFSSPAMNLFYEKISPTTATSAESLCRDRDEKTPQPQKRPYRTKKGTR